MRTPERRTLTGWRWRIREPRTARTRLRFVFGMPTRKIDFQTCELTMPSWTCFSVIPLPCGGLASLRRSNRSYLQKRLRVRPVPALLVKLDRLVDHDLAVGGID